MEHHNLCYVQPYACIVEEITISTLNFMTITWVMCKWKVGYFLKFEFICPMVYPLWKLKYDTQVQKNMYIIK